MLPLKQILTAMMFLVATSASISEAQSWRRPPGGPPPGRGHGNGGYGMQIQSATYGANCRAQYGNATWSVQRQCNGQLNCQYTVNVNELGDPAYGCAKDFRIEYRCPSGRVKTSSLPGETNGKTLYMNCNGGGGGGPIPRYDIHVISATYGGNFPEIPRGNVTHDIARECNNRQQCSYYISVNKIGDPKYGWSKDYRVEYTCDGRTVRTAYVGPEANTSTVHLSCF